MRGLLLAAGLGAICLVGCDSALPDPIASAHPADLTPRRGGTLRRATFADIRTLDPAVNGDALAAEPIIALYAGLVEFDASGHVVADLASRFEVEEGGLVYRFFLREGVRFHDGEELTADDVRRSIERALHPTTPDPFASQFDTIDGFQEFAEKKADHLRGVVVEGRYVVSIHLREPDARFLPMFGGYTLRPVCKSAGERYSDTWAPCGAGPYRLLPGGWDRGRSLTLTRHEGYFRPGRPYIDSVVLVFGMDRAAQAYKFEDGDLDTVHNLNEGDIHRLMHDHRWSPFIHPQPDRTINGEVLNTEVPPFDNVEVRRAVASGINREEYHRYKPASFAVASQVLPPSVPGFDPHFEGQRFDYQVALAHMAKAGYPYDPVTHQGGYPGIIPYYATREGATEYTFQILQQQMARIGLRLEGHIVNWATFLSLAGTHKAVAMSSPSWSMDYPDVADFFEVLFSSDAINDEQSSNYAFYRNAELDDLLKRGRREQDPLARKALYERANHIVCDEAPWAFTVTTRFFDAWQPYVRGFRQHAVWTFYTADTWLDRQTSTKADALGALWLSPGKSLVSVRRRGRP
jgi:ABC-type transport system substrate-binding protein